MNRCTDVYKNIHIICFTAAGLQTALRVSRLLREKQEYSSVTVSGCSPLLPDTVEKVQAGSWTATHFHKGNILVYVGACGIAVRCIAPYVRSKQEDPGVVVIDEACRFVIPLLSNHLGHANHVAQDIAGLTGAAAVLTTATDVNGLFAVDVFADANRLHISDMTLARHFSARLLDSGKASVLIPEELRDVLSVEQPVPPELEIRYVSAASETAPVCWIAPFVFQELTLIPECVVVGIGCRRGKSAEALLRFVTDVFNAHKLDLRAVGSVASIDIKQHEAGIAELCRKLSVVPCFFSAQELMSAQMNGGFSESEFVMETVGVDCVCERAAAAAGAVRLLVRKTVSDGMTIAVGVRTWTGHCL